MVKHKPRNYWRNYRNVEREIKGIIRKVGHFPSGEEFRQLRQNSLLSAIGDYHGGIGAVRENFGYAQVRNPAGYWKNFRNIKTELAAIERKLGYFPTSEDLKDLKKGSLARAIFAYHRGMNKVRKRLGKENGVKSPGYWQDGAVIHKAITKIVRERGYFPGASELQKTHQDIVHAISRYHGGFNLVRELYGFEELQKPAGYWEKWRNVKTELEGIIQREGNLPGATRLAKEGYSGLISAIHKHHGGFQEIRRKLGLEQLREKDGFWRDKKNVLGKVRGIIKTLGHFPTQADFSSLGLSGLSSAIGRYHGGTTKLKRDLGIQLDKKPIGHYSSWRHVKRELEEIMQEEGGLPGSQVLRKAGKSSLLAGITKYHGGISAVRKKLGLHQLKKPTDYWKDWKNVESECKRYIRKHGDLPSRKQLADEDNSALVGAISKHGGFHAVRKKLGLNEKSKRKDYWKDWSNVEKELKKIVRQQRGLPSHNELSELGYGGLASAIPAYHGGYPAVRERLGLNLLRERDGYWHDWKNVERELKKIVRRIKYFPSQKKLAELGRSSLAQAITYHGGFSKVRKKLGFEEERVPNGYWKDWKRVQAKLKEIMRGLGGGFPSSNYLVEIGCSDLGNAISRFHGGFYAVREKLGVAHEMRKIGYWQDWNHVKQTLEEVIRTDGHFPTGTRLKELGQVSLLGAFAKYHGGVEAVRTRLQEEGILPSEYQLLEDTVREYIQ